MIDEARGFVDGVAAGETVPAALAIGLVCLALILGFHAWLPRVPGVLVAVIVVHRRGERRSTSPTTASRSSGRCRRASRRSPWPGPLSDLPLLLAGAAGIALVSLADTISTASAFAARRHRRSTATGR